MALNQIDQVWGPGTCEASKLADELSRLGIRAEFSGGLELTLGRLDVVALVKALQKVPEDFWK